MYTSIIYINDSKLFDSLTLIPKSIHYYENDHTKQIVKNNIKHKITSMIMSTIAKIFDIIAYT